MIFSGRFRILFGFFLSLLSGVLLAASETDSSVMSKVFTADALYKLIGSFAAVFLLMFAVAYLMKKLNPLDSSLNKKFKVIAVLPFGAKQKAVLLQVGDEQIMLGISPENIRTLHVLPVALKQENSEPKVTQESEFPSNLVFKLSQLMTKKSVS